MSPLALAAAAAAALSVAAGAAAPPTRVAGPQAGAAAPEPPAAPAEAGPPRAPVVDEVAVRAPAAEDGAALRALVSVRPGRPLSAREVRRSVTLLYGLGRFGDVVARAEPTTAGHVRLVLDCVPRRVVTSLRVVRAAPQPEVADDRVRAALGLAPGDELWPGRADAAAARVRTALARLGHRAATVEVRAEGELEAAVTVLVREGPATTVEALRFPGAPAELAAGLAQGLATAPGATLDLDALDADARALRTRLRREGWLRARVGAPAVAVRGTRASVEIPVEPGPRFTVRIDGAETFTADELRPLLRLEAEGILDAPALEAAAGRLRAFYVAHGFAAAQARAAEVVGPARTALVFTVREGRRYRVREVRFPGAAGRDASWLRARLLEALDALPPPETSGPRADAERLALAAGSPSAAELRSPAAVAPRDVWDPPAWEAAAVRLLDLYRADGYLDVALASTRAVLDARAGTVDVELRLREGPRTVVESVAVEGSGPVPQATLAAEARLAPGDPLSFGQVEATRAALLSRLARDGYLYARVTDEESFSPDRSRATVRFRVDEGPQVRVGAVVVSGARRTREPLVRDALGLREGAVYDPDAAARGQSALLRLGVFRSVGVRLADADVPEARKDLLVELAERPWFTVAPGAGFSIANGPRAFVELVGPNLFGRAIELSGRAKVNYPLGTFRPDLASRPPEERVEGRAEVALRDPRVRILGLDVGARADAIGERLHRRAYDLGRASTVLGVDLPVVPRVGLALQYELELDRILRSEAASQTALLTRADVERLRFPEGVTTLQSVRPVLAIDFRDSTVQPRRGWLATGTADYAHSLGSSAGGYLFGLLHGSDVFTHMLKLSAAVSGYVPVGPSVLAVAVRTGRVLPLDPRSQTIGPKRFFLGGAATMRGYGEDEMVPEDVRAAYLEQVRACATSLSGVACSPAARQLGAGQAITSEGGESFLLGKAELRIPVRESVELGLFADVGNLWLDPRRVRPGELRVNFGAGLRFVTPVGPAVLDVGVNPGRDPRLGESLVAPHFSIGLF